MGARKREPSVSVWEGIRLEELWRGCEVEIEKRQSLAMEKAEEAATKDIDWERMERVRHRLKTSEAVQQWNELCSQVRSEMLDTPKTVKDCWRGFCGHEEYFDQQLVPKSCWKKLVVEWRRRRHGFGLPNKAYSLLLFGGPAFILGYGFKRDIIG